MSAKERAAAKERAYNKGERSFFHGKSIENNPYKVSMCGNGIEWRMGWFAARDSVKKDAVRVR